MEKNSAPPRLYTIAGCGARVITIFRRLLFIHLCVVVVVVVSSTAYLLPPDRASDRRKSAVGRDFRTRRQKFQPDPGKRSLPLRGRALINATEFISRPGNTPFRAQKYNNHTAYYYTVGIGI